MATAGIDETDALAAILRGQAVPSLSVGSTELVTAAADHGLTGLLFERMSRAGAFSAPLVSLKRAACTLTAQELVNHREIVSAIEALAASRVHPIVVKGTALAYSVYENPMARPREDTDLFIRDDDIDGAREALCAAGWTERPQCDIFNQVGFAKRSAFGFEHVLDVHWKISAQALFADMLTYDEVAAEAVSVPALGPHARMAGGIHALLLACVHPSMHHRNAEHLLWVYDVHLLAVRLTSSAFDRFTDLALEKRVAAIVRRQLVRARNLFGTLIPERVLSRLEAAYGEPSAVYLRDGRRWHDELLSNLRASSEWSRRWQLMRAILFPDPMYMRARYGLQGGGLAAALVPALYLDRVCRGLWKVATGRK